MMIVLRMRMVVPGALAALSAKRSRDTLLGLARVRLNLLDRLVSSLAKRSVLGTLEMLLLGLLINRTRRKAGTLLWIGVIPP